MPSEKQAFEGGGLPLRAFALAAAGTLAVVLVCLGLVFALYTVWVNGPQAPVRPGALANTTAPVLETELFRGRPLRSPENPKLAAAQGFRWSDVAHTRVAIPIKRAMAMTAARGDKAFDPPEGVASAPAGPP